MYKNLEIVERHRHRYEVNPKFKNKMISAGLDVVGTSIDGNLVEMIEIPNHKWFLACQFHPEFTSNPRDGHPIFNSYIKIVCFLYFDKIFYLVFFANFYT